VGHWVISAAQWAAVHPPVWSKALLYSGFAVWVIGGIALVRAKDLGAQRRAYWIGFLGGGALAAIALAFRGWAATAGAAALVAFTAVGYAYFFTSYLKLGGRVLTLSERRRTGTASGAYGDLTAPKMWWIIVGIAAIGAANTALGPWTWKSTLAVVLTAVMTAAAGFDDGRRRATVVRRQYLQAVLVAVASIPMWGIPVTSYLLVFAAGRMRPPPSSGRHDATARGATGAVFPRPDGLGGADGTPT